jgi:hypothetical protein
MVGMLLAMQLSAPERFGMLVTAQASRCCWRYLVVVELLAVRQPPIRSALIERFIAKAIGVVLLAEFGWDGSPSAP